MIDNETITYFLRFAIVLLFSSICFSCNEPEKKVVTLKEKIDERNPYFLKRI